MVGYHACGVHNTDNTHSVAFFLYMNGHNQSYHKPEFNYNVYVLASAFNNHVWIL